MAELVDRTSAYSAALLLAEVKLRLHALGVTTADDGDALEAAAELLRALHVEPAADPLVTQYRVRLLDARQSALAADEDAAEVIARAWSALPATKAGRTVVRVEPVGTSLPLVGPS